MPARSDNRRGSFKQGGANITNVNDFLTAMLPRLEAADTALHNGDVQGRAAMWSQRDPVTLFGATYNATGWDEIGPVFDTLAEQFSHCTSWELEVLAAGISDELAYIVGVEHTTASVAHAPAVSYSLRVTTIFRREDGEWKVVHRHGDPLHQSDSRTLHRLAQPSER
jgi:ketosteroid isomerase-like protein